MSTDFRPRRLITAADLFGGRLEKHGVRESKETEKDLLPPDEHMRRLTDGTNYLSVSISKRGFVSSITRRHENDPNNILDAIALEFDTDIISEHDAEFWEDYEGEVVAIDMSDFEKF